MQTAGLLGQLDKENSWCKDSGEKENERHLGKEVRTKACLVGKIVKSRMKWAGHMFRIKDEIFPKRAETNTFTSTAWRDEIRPKKVRGGRRKWGEFTANIRK